MVQNIGAGNKYGSINRVGQTKDGRIVIIDPECIRKKGIFSLLNYKLNKVKAYAKIIMK